MHDEPLAAAAWAGNLGARGYHVEAEKWSKVAAERLGKILLSTPNITVRLVGADPDVEDIDFVIETLQLTRNGYQRRAEKKAAAAKALETVSAPKEVEGVS